MGNNTKNILITGDSGFIGQNLVSELEKLGHNIFSFSSSKGFDINKSDDFKLFEDKNIDVVYHLAAKSFIPLSWENPSDFYQTNVLGTQNVLDFCKKTNSKLVYISAYIYGVPDSLPISEENIVKANNPYAHSKYLAEQLCQFYSSNFGLNTIILRPFNIYGEGQNDKFIIPLLIKQLQTNQITVKNMDTKRDYLHIADFVNACILSLNYDKNMIFNVGSGKSYSVENIIDIIQKVSGKNLEIICKNESRKNEIPDTIADIRLIKKEMNWEPKISFEEGLKELVNNEKRK